MLFERDWAGRLLRRRTAGDEFAYQYDLSGSLVAASGRTSAVTITRGADGRILSETVDGRTLTNEYDRAGRRVRRTTPTGVVSTWSFDAAGRAAELTTGAGRLAFDRDAAGREIARALGPDTWLLRDFDAAGRLATQQVWSGDRPHALAGSRTVAGSHTLAGPGGASPEQAGRLVVGRHYAYRSDGMPSEITDTLRGIRRFGSDELGRITSVDGASWSESYAYDAFGNLAQSVLPGDDDASGDRETDRTLIRRAGRTGYEHDEAGRLVKTTRRTLSGQRKVWTYTWDAEDHLAGVTLPDGTTWRYGYDPMGRRTAKARIAADGSVAEWISFVWDGMRLAEQHAVGPDGAVSSRPRTRFTASNTLPTSSTTRRRGTGIRGSQRCERVRTTGRRGRAVHPDADDAPACGDRLRHRRGGEPSSPRPRRGGAVRSAPPNGGRDREALRHGPADEGDAPGDPVALSDAEDRPRMLRRRGTVPHPNRILPGEFHRSCQGDTQQGGADLASCGGLIAEAGAGVRPGTPTDRSPAGHDQARPLSR
jgi:YD repeat-containing protein